MGTKLIVMSPRPGRITHLFDLPFSRQFLDGITRAAGQGVAGVHRAARRGPEDHLRRRGGRRMTAVPASDSPPGMLARLVPRAADQPGRDLRRAGPGEYASGCPSPRSRCCCSSGGWSPTLGWVKPLFVPSPQAVAGRSSSQIWHEGFTNTRFLEHILISTAAGVWRLPAGLPDRHAAGSCHGDEPADPRHLRPAHRILPARSRRWPTCR